MLLVRVQLPDRPGSLGTVATAMGLAGADISAIEIVEKLEGHVIDDFMLTLPLGIPVDELVSECTDIEGVDVLWVSRYPDSWGLEGDVELLNRITSRPGRGAEVLTEQAPVAFHCQWAALLETGTGRMLHGSAQSPDFAPEHLALLGALDELRTHELPANWLPHWGEVVLAVVPLPVTGTAPARTLVAGRQGGPAFLESELRRLAHLAAMA